MKILDAGHLYKLDQLDKVGELENVPEVWLRFVKREGDTYPGNVGHYPGTTIQEVCRVLIDRLKYVDNQAPCEEDKEAISHLRYVMWLLEKRAFERHGLYSGFNFLRVVGIENLPVNSHGHLWEEK